MSANQIRETIHDQIVKNCSDVFDWFDSSAKGLTLPIYSSFDVRDSGVIVAPVDANIFPAGFNNICPTDKENAPALFENYLAKHYPNSGRRIGLIAEEHTSNAYYWQNVATIKELLEASGCTVEVCWPKTIVSAKQPPMRKEIMFCAFSLDNVS